MTLQTYELDCLQKQNLIQIMLCSQGRHHFEEMGKNNEQAIENNRTLPKNHAVSKLISVWLHVKMSSNQNWYYMEDTNYYDHCT